MKKVILFLTCALFLSGCGDSGSQKWRLDNPNLTSEERAELTKAIERKSEIEQRNSWRTLNGEEWCYLLKYFPELEKKCSETKAWYMFNHELWANLLAEDIRFIKTFEKKSYGNYSLFDGNDWNIILQKHPDLIKKGDSAKVWDEFGSKSWVFVILNNNTALIERCNKYKGWDSLTINDWITIILKSDKYRDKFFQYVNPSKLTKENWIKLFSQSLDITDCLPISKCEEVWALGKKAANSNKKDSFWKNQYEKQLAEIAKVEKFNKQFFALLMEEAKKCHVFDEFNNKELIDIMSGNLDYAEKFLEYLNWNELLTKYNNKYRGDFIQLLGKKPSLIKSLPPKFELSLSKDEKFTMLCENYESVRYIDKNIFNEIFLPHWEKLLSKDKRYIDIFIKKRPWESWDEHNANSFWKSVAFIPELNEISRSALRTKTEWIDIVTEEPNKLEDFIKYYPIVDESMHYGISKRRLESVDWKIMILKNPLISDMYDSKFKIWEKRLWLDDKIEIAKTNNKFEKKLQNAKSLRGLSESMWSELLVAFPSLRNLYDKSKRSNKEWLYSLEYNYENEIGDFIGFAAYKNFGSRDIASLIKLRPNILDICYNDKDFISYLFKDKAYKDFSLIGASLYFHAKNNSNKKAFDLLKKMTDKFISRIKSNNGTDFEATGNLIVDINRLNLTVEEYMMRSIIEAFTVENKKHICLYYMARCYKEGYATEKNDGISGSYYLILNKMLRKNEELKNGEIYGGWETLYEKL